MGPSNRKAGNIRPEDAREQDPMENHKNPTEKYQNPAEDKMQSWFPLCPAGGIEVGLGYIQAGWWRFERGLFVF